jgi:hypothetical protein
LPSSTLEKAFGDIRWGGDWEQGSDLTVVTERQCSSNFNKRKLWVADAAWGSWSRLPYEGICNI